MIDFPFQEASATFGCLRQNRQQPLYSGACMPVSVRILNNSLMLISDFILIKSCARLALLQSSGENA